MVVPTTRKLPLTQENLDTVVTRTTQPFHDDLLFVTQILTGTECLMRLAELTWPDKIELRDYGKSIHEAFGGFLTQSSEFLATRSQSRPVFQRKPNDFAPIYCNGRVQLFSLVP